jgi:hypothetical protein
MAALSALPFANFLHISIRFIMVFGYGVREFSSRQSELTQAGQCLSRASVTARSSTFSNFCPTRSQV